VFVPGALPGETVRLRVVEDRKRWARAELLEVLDAAPTRTTPPCPVADTCGGCDLQHVTPEGQRDLKRRVVREQLERLGGFDAPDVAPTREVGTPLGYRAHARLHAAPDGRLGFHRAGSTEVVPVEHCPVLTPAAQRLRSQVGDRSGAVEVEVRADGVTGASGGAVVLQPGPGPLDVPQVDGDVLLEQPDGSSVALSGDGVLEVTVAGLSFTLPRGAFFQVSTAAAEALVEEVLDAVGDPSGALVWDLYAGVGLLSLPLVRAGAEVVAVEGNADAAAAAVANAERNGLEVAVIEANVFDFLKDAEVGYDLIILDPPSFTRNKKSLRGALRGYKEIHLRALKMLEKGGRLATFCCSHHVSREVFLESLVSASVDAKRTIRLVAEHTQRADHPVLPAIAETHYLKGFTVEVIPSR